MRITITPDFIEKFRTDKDGYLGRSLRFLGVPWPPQSGWKMRIMGNVLDVNEDALKRELDAVAARREKLAGIKVGLFGGMI